MAITRNLAKVDKDQKFDAVFDKHYGFLSKEYMVSAANVVGNSGKIALANPYLIQKIIAEFLNVENISVAPHSTKECKKVITENNRGFRFVPQKKRGKRKEISICFC